MKQSINRMFDKIDSRYLASLKLSQSSVLDMWGGLQYLPLEAEPFLRVQSLVNRCLMMIMMMMMIITYCQQSRRDVP